MRDPDAGTSIVLLTNHSALQGEAISQLYRDRWRIEIFFRWIKQHLRIKAFYGRSPNAVLVQVWIAVSVYVLIAILRKRLGCHVSLYELLQILSVLLFEPTPLEGALQGTIPHDSAQSNDKQLILSGY